MKIRNAFSVREEIFPATCAGSRSHPEMRLSYDDRGAEILVPTGKMIDDYLAIQSNRDVNNIALLWQRYVVSGDKSVLQRRADVPLYGDFSLLPDDLSGVEAVARNARDFYDKNRDRLSEYPDFASFLVDVADDRSFGAFIQRHSQPLKASKPPIEKDTPSKKPVKEDKPDV